MEQKPHKKEELMLANNVLRLAENLLKVRCCLRVFHSCFCLLTNIVNKQRECVKSNELVKYLKFYLLMVYSEKYCMYRNIHLDNI